MNFFPLADLKSHIDIEERRVLFQVSWHDCANVEMVALGPRMLARLNFKATLHTLQQPLKAPAFLAGQGIVQPKFSQEARNMGSASGDSSRDPPPALVLCGPSGAGKSTLMKLLTSEFRWQGILMLLPDLLSLNFHMMLIH